MGPFQYDENKIILKKIKPAPDPKTFQNRNHYIDTENSKKLLQYSLRDLENFTKSDFLYYIDKNKPIQDKNKKSPVSRFRNSLIKRKEKKFDKPLNDYILSILDTVGIVYNNAQKENKEINLDKVQSNFRNPKDEIDNLLDELEANGDVEKFTNCVIKVEKIRS